MERSDGTKGPGPVLKEEEEKGQREEGKEGEEREERKGEKEEGVILLLSPPHSL